jgi:hypothetical protein
MEYVPCVCHTGVTWDPEALTPEGFCPQYWYERYEGQADEVDAEWGM